MGELLAFNGRSLSLGRDAMMIVGGTVALGPIGGLIGLGAAIGFEAQRLQLESYRLRQTASEGARRFELQRQALRIAQFRADTERLGVSGSLFLEAASREATLELARMQRQIEARRTEVENTGRRVAADTFRIKQAAATHQIKIDHVGRALERAATNIGRSRNPDASIVVVEILGNLLESLGPKFRSGATLSAHHIDEVLEVPDLVTVPRRLLRG